jgi:predicted glycosyltransferase
MLNRRLYYQVKPYMPWRIRMVVRRTLARRQRSKHLQTWPINEIAGHSPPGWPGWPQGKKFAFVLTHDVEGLSGLAKCRQLMQLDKDLGFRSSFNLVPEGEYGVSRLQREEIVRNGFEIGVHDLRHDGTLYRTRQLYSENARRINHYLNKWDAVGFRSGFMLHQLDLLRELNILYDSSTFDTDPFEPQPDGAHTIFPFWVPRLRGGYVELPYTLVQDSTLFLVLGEKDAEIWKRKLDWIARHGGMALVNVHPDYLRFPGEPPSARTFPVEKYTEFLQYVSSCYGGSFWQPLPREVAQYVREHQIGHRVAKRDDQIVNSPLSKTMSQIWIDLDNTPHVPFFAPIIDELRSRGYPVLVTARDAFQVCELASKLGVACRVVGRHNGKNPILKVAGLFHRAMQLVPTVRAVRPALAVSHGSRSQVIASHMLGIPSLLLTDYEHAKYPPLMRPDWEMVPDVIPHDVLCCLKNRVRTYAGIKEDVYAWRLNPDPGILETLGINNGKILITVRPPATEAHYHNPESERLFTSFMNLACDNPNVRVVLLPRNKRQAEMLRKQSPEWFENQKTVVPPALDGLNLIWHSDLVVSGGGTMNREAAALGVPVYSIFRGPIGAVDRHLAREGRLVLVANEEELRTKIAIRKRPALTVADVTSRKVLLQIVETIEEVLRLSKSP